MSRITKFAVTVFTSSVLLIGAAEAEETASQSISIWDGIYTEEQAARGEEEYVRNCASCHGTALIPSNEDYPGLVGPPFEYSWHGQTVAERLERIHLTMPYSAPGTLSLETTADILAYILAFNGYPSGDRELDPNSDALQQITIEPPQD